MLKKKQKVHDMTILHESPSPLLTALGPLLDGHFIICIQVFNFSLHNQNWTCKIAITSMIEHLFPNMPKQIKLITQCSPMNICISFRKIICFKAFLVTHKLSKKDCIQFESIQLCWFERNVKYLWSIKYKLYLFYLNKIHLLLNWSFLNHGICDKYIYLASYKKNTHELQAIVKRSKVNCRKQLTN